MEAVRGFAAAYVFFAHSRILDGTPFALMARFGQEAVILFFILSGFVIHYSTFRNGRRLPFRFFFVHRLRRIYPIFFLSLSLSYLQSVLVPEETSSADLTTLAGNVAMLQDSASLKPGVWFDTFADNGPLWSLSYEWWFYLLYFAVVALVADFASTQKLFAFGLTILGVWIYQFSPNQPCLILGYLYIWWAGAEIAREYLAIGGVSWRGQRVNLLLTALAMTAWAIPVLYGIETGVSLRLGVSPVLQLRHAGSAVIVLISGIGWYRIGLPGFSATLAPFRFLAPISYSLYVFHNPMLRLTRAALGTDSHILTAAITLAVLLPMCYLVEIVFQNRLNRATGRLLLASGTGQEATPSIASAGRPPSRSHQ